MTTGFFGPPAYLVKADAESAKFEAPDKSWKVTMTRDKWREIGRPEALYAMPQELGRPE